MAAIRPGVAQELGTYPPRSMIGPDASSGKPNPDKLRIEGFFFLDRSGTPVLMPGVSYEEFDRLKNLEAGIDSRSDVFDFQSLEIIGTASEGRAELKVVIRLTIDSTGGRTVAIPLGMQNFHPLGPPDVTGLDDFHMAGSGSDSGHRLLVNTKQRHEAVVTMNVAARVEPGPPSSLEFRLPDVPSQVRIATDENAVTGEIVGRGDEVIQSTGDADKPSAFLIESGGGTFTLRWGKLDRDGDNSPQLEIDNSSIVLQWDSPQDQPMVSCQMIVRNARGVVDKVKLRLPKNSSLFGTPTLGTSEQEVEMIGPTPSPEGDTIEVRIPEIPERQQRVDLRLTLQMNIDQPSAVTPMVFRVPEVIGALRQRGEIQVMTGDDYRLRWRSRPWVQSTLAQPDDESGRSYFFRYDRASFDLPMWLATTRRQLRVATEAEISLHDTIARIDYRILPSGRATDGTVLKVDFGDWRLRSIENSDSAQRIEAVQNGSYYEIYLESLAGGDPAPIRMIGEHDLGHSDNRSVSFELPRITEIEDTMLVQSANVSIANRGRSLLVVDLEASQNVDRSILSETSTIGESSRTRYRVIPPDASGKLVGRIVEQSPSITIAGNAAIEVDQENLRATLDWTVTSSLDLEGRLPIQIPSLSPLPKNSDVSLAAQPFRQPSRTLDLAEVDSINEQSTRVGAGEQGQAGDLEGLAEAMSPAAPDVETEFPAQWTVSVNSLQAVLEPVEGDRYVLISDQLASGSMSVQWNLIRPLRRDVPPSEKRQADSSNGEVTSGDLVDEDLASGTTSIDQLETITIPRPVAVDTTFRGTMRVSLQGDLDTELFSTDASAENMMVFDALPREPIRLRVRSREAQDQNLFVSKAVLRSAVGYATRMEQLLAEVQGGRELRIGLPVGDFAISAEAFVDARPAVVRRDRTTLVISLPDETGTHSVDLRVWLPMVLSPMAGRVEPALTLPLGVGSVYWEIASPESSHVIWASPALGRSMAWRYDRWRLYREPTRAPQWLADWVGENQWVEIPEGNRYLYLGSDVRSFQAVLVSRSVLWAATASIVLFLAVLLTFFPQSRHPLTVVVAAVLFVGMLLVAPDAAVLAGQIGMIALALVAIMLAIRSLIQTGDQHSALSSRPRGRRSDFSNRPSQEGPASASKSLSATRSIAGSSRVNKVSP
ncbi:TIGR04086 family membrane protein [Novipirellula artificiosorum]|uniref:Uncharacterized protein n=1 Tax=Novipirellula artificiosorum TaxID=2528016 RepID=A0A5C6DFF9_9BACT|nr:TIGR04086 family membrane protein [Novipirellula artificiosorum]TWU33689.1 hypothetical protein Poly41_46850 [Novipirellula artificiosorum]